MPRFNTVLGSISPAELGVTLPHEHICCYSEYALTMYGSRYLDKDALAAAAADYLRTLRERFGLSTFIDCTPVNIGRDIPLLQRVSRESGVHIICSTGFYYTEESVLGSTPYEVLADYIINDARRVNAGIIKCAVEQEQLSPYLEKVLRACAAAQRELGLPIVMHTNARRRNALPALEILLSEGVRAQAVTVGHLSDTEDLSYLLQVADHGCFLALDRLYGNVTPDYIGRKVDTVRALCRAGFGDRLLLSHDALFFSGFDREPRINACPRYAYCFEHILPALDAQTADDVMIRNPLSMLRLGQ